MSNGYLSKAQAENQILQKIPPKCKRCRESVKAVLRQYQREVDLEVSKKILEIVCNHHGNGSVLKSLKRTLAKIRNIQQCFVNPNGKGSKNRKGKKKKGPVKMRPGARSQ